MQRFALSTAPSALLMAGLLLAASACSSSRPAPGTTTAAPASDVTTAAPAPAAERRMVFAGPGGPGANLTPEQRADLRLARLDTALALSAEQKARLRPVLLAEILEMPQMRREDAQNMTQEQMMAMVQQMQERRERVNRLIEAQLTPAQVTQYRAYLQQERERMMQRGRRMGM